MSEKESHENTCRNPVTYINKVFLHDYFCTSYHCRKVPTAPLHDVTLPLYDSGQYYECKQGVGAGQPAGAMNEKVEPQVCP